MEGEGHERPVRPQSEYGERPAGSPTEPHRAEGRQRAEGEGGGPDELDAHRSEVLAILKRGGEMASAQVAEETDLEATQVSTVLTRLQRDGAVVRTATGKWTLSAASETKVEPTPHPREPSQES